MAKAIFECQTPVISAVGHETDITIADFVADLRAPTPSAAAELAVPDVRVLLANLSDMEDKLDQLLIGKVHLHRQYLEQYRLRLSHLSPKSQVREKRMRLMDMEERLSGLANRVLERKKHERDLYLERLSGLSPLARLSGGYACVMSGKGQLVRSVEDVSAGDILTVSVADGDIKASVIKTTKLRRNAHGEGKNIRNSI